MEEQKDKERKGNKEYKKFKKLLKKAYKACVKENQLDAFINEAKKNFPGYIKAREAYNKAPYNADSVPLANYSRAKANFYEVYAKQIDKYSTIARKACDLRLDFEKMLMHAGEKENEEE